MEHQPLLDKTVLIVEDEMLVGLDVKQMLLESGCAVLGPCPSIKKAEQLIETSVGIDIALLDVNLRGDYVYPLALLLREKGIPIVFASGYDKSNLPKEFRSMPIVSKPYSKQECVHALADALKKHER